MKSFCRLKFVLQQNEFLWNVDLKDANCSIHLSNLYEFLCLCFGLGSKPKVFTKLLEVLNYWPVRRVTNWLDPRQYSDGKIDFSITKLRFVINFKKSVLDPAKHIEFLNLCIDTEKITLSLSQKKLWMLQQCQGNLLSIQTFDSNTYNLQNWQDSFGQQSKLSCSQGSNSVTSNRSKY